MIEDYDYIEELESYLRNLNLSEPYYEFMVKKEKNGRAIKLIHICTIKVCVNQFYFIFYNINLIVDNIYFEIY